jgi:hypothetical protein
LEFSEGKVLKNRFCAISGITQSSRESLSGVCGSKSPSPSRLSDHSGGGGTTNEGQSKASAVEKGSFRKESGAGKKKFVFVILKKVVLTFTTQFLIDGARGNAEMPKN